MTVYALHGIVSEAQEGFAYRGVLDAQAFAAFLTSHGPFAPLERALAGAGDALTIDDATEASLAAARLAASLQCEVTVFINPGPIEAGRPYCFAVVNALLDAADATEATWRDRDWPLASEADRSRFRRALKDEFRHHSSPGQDEALIGALCEALGAHPPLLAPHSRTVTAETVRRAAAEGVRFGDHYFEHHDPSFHSPEHHADQRRRAAAWFADVLGEAPAAFAHPFGDPAPDAAIRPRTGWLLLDPGRPEGPSPDGSYNRTALRL